MSNEEAPRQPITHHLSANVESASTVSALLRVLRLPKLSSETRAVAAVLFILGAVLEIWKRTRAVGDNLLSVAVVAAVVDGLSLVQWLLHMKGGKTGHRILSALNLQPRDDTGKP